MKQPLNHLKASNVPKNGSSFIPIGLRLKATLLHEWGFYGKQAEIEIHPFHHKYF
jgi:hypothetical protein